MKKLILAAVLSAFSFTAAAAFACDGMKASEKSEKGESQAKSKDKKSDKADQKS